MKNKNFFDTILQNANNRKKYPEIDMFIYQNKEAILRALNIGVSAKIIYDSIISETNITISYKTVLKKLNNLKKLSKMDMQAGEFSSKSNEIVTDEKPHTISADVNSNSEHVAEEPKKMSRQERLLAMRNRPDEEKIIDIQKDQKKFVWKPSIKE